MSEYQTAYEAALRENLNTWVEQHYHDGQHARQEFAAKAEEYSENNAMGFGYQLGWKMEDVIEAEVRAATAYVLNDVLNDGGSPEEAVEAAERYLNELTAKGLNTFSTLGVTNLAALFAGRAAHDLNGSGWSSYSFRAAIDSAKWKAEREIAGEEMQVLTNLKEELRNLGFSKPRTEKTIAAKEQRQQELGQLIQAAERDVDEKLATAKEA